jgi:phage tail sheath protein FI
MPYPLKNFPGVQIDEVMLGSPPIFGVGTSVAGFVGNAPKPDASIKPNVPHLVTTEDEFRAGYADGAAKSTNLTRAVIGFFRNGGGQCYVVHTSSESKSDLLAGIDALEVLEDVNILAVPGSSDKDVYSALEDQATRKRDRFAILDPPPRVAKLEDFNDGGQNTPAGAKRPANSQFAAFYYPRIKVRREFPGDPIDGEFVTPSGHLAGVYARVDSNRGVFKAPANETIAGATDVEHPLTDGNQDSLNAQNVDLIRNFGGAVTVWGGRTLVAKDPSGPDAEYRYISTRRFVSFVEASLKAGLRFAVFEPNNLKLRQIITRSVRGFLDGLWRDGALFGESPANAYYIHFPENYNRDDDRKKGLLVVEIGLRISYPAEFIIIRIGPLSDDPAAS